MQWLMALIAGLMGFGAIAMAFAGVTKVVLVIFLVLFLVSSVTHLARRV